MIRRVVGIHFSPVGGTAGMTRLLVENLAAGLGSCSPEEIRTECYELLSLGDDHIELDDETIAVIGMPVYVGKIPLPGINLLKSKVHPRDAVTVIAVSYGAKTYGNALYELLHHAEEQGYKVIGAGAFPVRYFRSRRRDDGDASRSTDSDVGDRKSLSDFSKAASAKISRLAGCEIEGLKITPPPIEVSGRLPVHGVSRFSPRAAAAAQDILEKFTFRRRSSEWYL